MPGVLTVVDGAATAHTISSLRAACDLLDGAAGRINAVSVSGVLPDSEDPTLPVMGVAQRLAAEHHLAVMVSVEGRRFVVEFRRVGPTDSRMSEAG
jgi:hypothetical protein